MSKGRERLSLWEATSEENTTSKETSKNGLPHITGTRDTVPTDSVSWESTVWHKERTDPKKFKVKFFSKSNKFAKHADEVRAFPSKQKPMIPGCTDALASLAETAPDAPGTLHKAKAEDAAETLLT